MSDIRYPTLFALIVSALMMQVSTVSIAQSKLYFVHNDHLGTPQVLTDKDQNIVWRAEEQLPFGEVAGFGSVKQPIRFPGQYADEETGYYYNYYRDYDPSLGRYIQSDPIGLQGGLNTYAYVEGNPLSNIDPLGLAVSRLCVGAELDPLGKYQPGCRTPGGGWSGAGKSCPAPREGQWKSLPDAGAAKASDIKKAASDAFRKATEGASKQAHSGQGDKKLRAQAKALEDFVKNNKKDFLKEYLDPIKKEASRLRERARSDRHK